MVLMVQQRTKNLIKEDMYMEVLEVLLMAEHGKGNPGTPIQPQLGHKYFHKPQEIWRNPGGRETPEEARQDDQHGDHETVRKRARQASQSWQTGGQLAFAFPLSEMVQYNQTQVDSIAELECRLEETGYAVDARIVNCCVTGRWFDA